MRHATRIDVFRPVKATAACDRVIFAPKWLLAVNYRSHYVEKRFARWLSRKKDEEVTQPVAESALEVSTNQVSLEARTGRNLPDTIAQDPAQLTADEALWIKRDVSRMRYMRDKMDHVDKPPKLLFEKQKQIKFVRARYGMYGEEKSGVSPSMAWPTIEELSEKLAFEKRLGKPTLHESWEYLRQKRETETQAAAEHEKKVITNMKEMKHRLREFRERQKAVADAAQAERKKRDELLEEARNQLGFDVDPRDPRFIEIMEQRDVIKKKERRLKKKKDKEDSVLDRLKEMVEQDTAKGGSAATTTDDAADKPDK